METKDWISVNDELPPDGEQVLVHLNHSQDWKFAITGIQRGISKEERAMLKQGKCPNDKFKDFTVEQLIARGRRGSAGDEAGNNTRPYEWVYGDSFHGQQVTHWMKLIPPKGIKLSKKKDKIKHHSPEEKKFMREWGMATERQLFNLMEESDGKDK